MTIKMPRNLMTAISVVAFAVMLHGCGGGGGSSPATTAPDETTMDDTTTTPTTTVGQTVPDGTVITVPGVELPDIEVTAVMGQTIPYPGIGTFTCASAEGCSVVVADNVITTTGEIVVDAVADDSVDALLYAALNTEPVELNELETAQAAAVDAATAAKTAADNAETAATAAKEAGTNLATLQTGETARSLAEEAAAAAYKAMAAYMEAKAASDEAAEAEDITSAVEAKAKAVAAQATAETAALDASEKGTAAEEAAVVELKIDGLRKSVGDDTAIMADAGSSQVITGVGADAQTVITGLIKSMNPMTPGAAVGGKAFVEAMPDENPAVVGVAHVQAVAKRDLTIGKTLDSDDDMARLMLVTHYAGTNSVKVYAKADADPADDTADDLTGTVASDGSIQTVGVDTPLVATDDVFVTLKSVGMYYLATGGQTGEDVSTGRDQLDHTDLVGAKAEATEVFSYPSDTDNNADTDDVTVYVVLESSEDTTGVNATTTVVYQHVDITVVGPADEDGDPTTMGVKANIPEATEYKHIHFGVWAALGDAKKGGSQAPSDLGIGFVQNISGEGMTADMPNNGGASYTGNWVATVRGADPDGNGDIVLQSGASALTANFTKATIEATLTGLAKLEGDIDTNTFSGTKATVMDDDPHGLDSDGKFTGSFSGGFFGDATAEAGGVFDFTSKDAADGEFRGAFGGDRDPE